MKLIREHINEKFEEKSDPIFDLNIGKKRLIINWINYINTTFLRDINNTKSPNYINKNYYINNDYTIDVGTPLTHEDILLNYQRHIGDVIAIRGDIIKKLPDFIQFNNCYGNCFLNVSEITSLKGVPRKVFGNFCINHNPNLKSLKFFPDIIYCDVYLSPYLSSKIPKQCKIYGQVKPF